MKNIYIRSKIIMDSLEPSKPKNIWANVMARVLSEELFGDDFTVDISETSTQIIVRAELPGIDRKDLTVDYIEGLLTIKAERREKIEDKDTRYIRKESRYGMTQRSFTVGLVDPENINALYQDGILMITLTKSIDETTKVEIK